MQSQTSSYVLSTLITPPSTYFLTTVDDVKDELGITTTEQDTRLTRYIAGESANIARYCNRVFGLATWQDVIRPQRGIWGEGVRSALNPQTLSKWPLVSSVVNVTGNTHSTNVIDGLSSTTGLLAGQLIFGAGITNGTSILSVNAAGSSVLLSQPATATATGIAFNTGLQVVEVKSLTHSKTLVAGVDFEVEQGSLLPGDEGVGALYRLNHQGRPRTWHPVQLVVTYQAGYALPDMPVRNGFAPLPQDLQDTCLDIVVGRYMARARDPLLKAEEKPNLGRQEWWIGASPGQSGPYPNEIMAVLDRYRVPVTAAA